MVADQPPCAKADSLYNARREPDNPPNVPIMRNAIIAASID